MVVRKFLGLVSVLFVLVVWPAFAQGYGLLKINGNTAGRVVSQSGRVLLLSHVRGKVLEDKIGQHLRKGRSLYIIRPGFSEVVCRILRKKKFGVWQLRINRSAAKYDLLGERVYFDVKQTKIGRAQYLLMKRSVVARYMRPKKAHFIMKRAESLIKQKQFGLALRDLLTVYKAKGVSTQLRAQALYKISILFYADVPFMERVSSLNDFPNSREILFDLVRSFRSRNLWREAAYYRLAEFYASVADVDNNRRMYHFLKKAGRFKHAFFTYGRNLLRTAPRRAILMTEGGDNQVFGLQMLTRIEKLRPDVTIYDQKGNVFEKIYGDFRYMRAREVRIKRAVVDFEIFSRGRPVYLTWQRSPLVADCGDWALQRQGLLWRVVPLRYRLPKLLAKFSARNKISYKRVAMVVRALYAGKSRIERLKHNLRELQWYIRVMKAGKSHFINSREKRRVKRSVARYRVFLKKAIARRIDKRFIMSLLRRLQRERLIRVKGRYVHLLRWSPLASSIKIWKKYRFPSARYSNRNIADWPYLIREIVSNNNFYRLRNFQESLRELPMEKRYGMIALWRAKREKILYNKEIDKMINRILSCSKNNYAMRVNMSWVCLGRKQYKKTLKLLRKWSQPRLKYLYACFLYWKAYLDYANQYGDPGKEKRVIESIKKVSSNAYSLLRQAYGSRSSRVKDYRLFKLLERLASARTKYSIGFQISCMYTAQRTDAWEDYQKFCNVALVRQDYTTLSIVFEQMPSGKWRKEFFVVRYVVALYRAGRVSEALHALDKGLRFLPDSQILKKYRTSIIDSLLKSI